MLFAKEKQSYPYQMLSKYNEFHSQTNTINGTSAPFDSHTLLDMSDSIHIDLSFSPVGISNIRDMRLELII